MLMTADLVTRNRRTHNFSLPVDPSAVAARDRLLSELIGTRAFRRLKSVRFLGGIDYLLVRSPNGNLGNIRYTRYQHSLGVARLALLYSNLCHVASSERRLIVAAAVLHDIGHGPLSHSLEPVFNEVFGLEHHRVTEDIITGRLPLGREVFDTLCRHKVDVERVIAMIQGQDSTHDDFFSGPINFDTIEGILRASNYAKTNKHLLRPGLVVEAAFRRSGLTDREIVDRFWVCKDYIYRYIINSRLGIIADFACMLFMRRHIDMMTADDYFASESHIFRKLHGLRQLLTSPSLEARVLEQANAPITYKARRFFIEPGVDFFARRDKERYRQTSEVRTLLAKSVGAQDISTRDLFHDEGDCSGKGAL
jgi:uncharacterized protein